MEKLWPRSPESADLIAALRALWSWRFTPVIALATIIAWSFNLPAAFVTVVLTVFLCALRLQQIDSSAQDVKK